MINTDYNSSIEGNDVLRWLDKMADESYQRRVLYKAIMDGARVLQKNTKTAFIRKVGDAASHYSKEVGGPFYDGVRIKGDRAYLGARVHIMKDYRMKWFEKGTNERYTGYKIRDGKYERRYNATDSKHSTGRMDALYFFREAREMSEGQIEEAIMKSINNAYQKIQKK